MVLQAGPEALEKLVGALGLDCIDDAQGPGALEAEDLALVEVVVPRGAAIEGRSALSMLLLQRTGVALLGVSREGRRFVERVRRLTVRAGDILLLLGPSDSIAEAVPRLGALPLANRGLQLIQRRKTVLAVVIFLAAILLASFGVIYFAGALAAVVVLYVLFAIVPTREIYESIEWPVIVLLGSMIPIGAALEASGGTAVVAQAIVDVTLGAAPWVVLTLLMVVTMTLSDIMNNMATAVIAAPIAIDVAGQLGVDPDPFLMAVAVAASCAFLTPIGHKNNTLIMGPGGYRFSDYWRMGLPLEVLVVAVSIPMILWVWPF